MEIVGMDIARFWFSGPKSRSVSICSAFNSWMFFLRCIFYFEKMTFLDFVDMYLMIFDITIQHFIRFNQYLSKFIKQCG